MAAEQAAFQESKAAAGEAESPPLSIREFLELPREFGWRYQLVDGRLLRTPWIIPIPVRIATDRGSRVSRGELRRPVPEDRAALANLYREAFAGTRSYFGWREEEIRQDGTRSIDSFFQGERGEPQASSRILATQEGVAGAALVVRWHGVPSLFLLFVSPALRRRGVAGALVSEVLRALRAHGDAFLRSAFDGGDAGVASWYRAFGFIEEPSLPVAYARVAWLRGEVDRRKRTGGAGAYREELPRLAETIRSLAERVEAEGTEAVFPDLAVWQRRWWPDSFRSTGPATQ